ncbi:hypothetical protein SpCBS45565_g03769 [Spizellomyces sp. 'palustris']|nr:hypothetical protein SpCBS45565_g03769 [Spizellomyces sp. 'palustris']
MGLCKCRNVTNLFCFPHRKNVCEKCMLTEHPRCVVRPYLTWLQNSDFSTNCDICKRGLEEGSVVRLPCLDVFHVDCLRNYSGQGAGQCPSCAASSLPNDTKWSLVAEHFIKTFEDGWGQTTQQEHVIPTPSNPTLSITIGDSSLDRAHLPSPRTPVSGKSNHTNSIPLNTIKQPSRKPSYRDIRDGDADKYGRHNAAGGWRSSLSRLCDRRLSMRRLIFLILLAVVVFTFSTTTMLRMSVKE